MPFFRFFASYARSNMGRNQLLLRFCEDLIDVVRARISATEAYFFDEQSILPGDEFPASLESALQNTRSFLAFYSPAYFNSPDCSREIKAFQIRVADYRQTNANPGSCGPLGILWESEAQIKGKLPASLQDAQYNVPPHRHPARTAELHKMLQESGLRLLIQRAEAGSQEEKLAYLDIVECYADHIQRTTAACDLTPYRFRGAYRDLPYDFPRQETIAATPPVGGTQPPEKSLYTGPKGPTFIKVLLLVGKAKSFAGIKQRTSLDCYSDEDDRLWRPYFPNEDHIFSLVSRAVNAERGIIETLRWDTPLTKEALLNTIDAIENNNNVLIIVADPWSCLITQLSPGFNVLDERRIDNAAIFLPLNHEDIDTKTSWQDLEDALSKALKRIERSTGLTALIYDSPKALEDQVRLKIVELRSQIVASAARRGHLRKLPTGSPLPTVTVASR
jgi:hypothetical protein